MRFPTRAASIASSPDERWILVANRDSNNVSVIEQTEPGLFVVRAPALDVGPQPSSLDISGNGRMAAVLNDTPNAVEDYVTLIDLAGSAPTVLGDGPERSRLEEMAGPTVRFVGAMGRDELRTAYARAQALLFCGVEDFGIVPVEAMATGCPVVALGAGGAL